jgi:hypothetical protein
MGPAEKSEIIDILEKSTADFQAAAGSIPEFLATIRPEADRWSVLECVEHVTTVEEIFLTRLAGGTPGETPPEDRDKEAMLAKRLSDRSSRRQAPEAILPKGRFASLAQGLEEFHRVRARSMQFALDHAADLYTLASSHPVLGPLNGMEAMIILAGHSSRHADQIREVRAALEKR